MALIQYDWEQQVEDVWDLTQLYAFHTSLCSSQVAEVSLLATLLCQRIVRLDLMNSLIDDEWVHELNFSYLLFHHSHSKTFASLSAFVTGYTIVGCY